MSGWNLKEVNLGVLMAALLLPGGILLLGWLLCRRYFSTGRAAQVMKRWVPVAILAALAQGCATQLAMQGSGDPEDASRQALLFQNPAVAPRDDAAPVSTKDLRPGDIVLTSSPGLVSASIQLLTLSPVSHAAIYIGDGRIVEAVRPAVRVRRLDELLAEDFIVLAFRHPDLSPEQGRSVSDYAVHKTGTVFNYLGVTLQVPFSVTRKMCELPLVPSALRDACIRMAGLLSYLAPTGNRTFCSQLVLDAYRQAGLPITSADPRLITPSDILHMREGDVPSVRVEKQLRYVGYLKYQRPLNVAALDQ